MLSYRGTSMSIKVMTEVWDFAPLTGTELLILLALADMANDERRCWPSLNTIAKKGRTTVQNTINILDELSIQNILEINKRKAEDGGNLSNMYYIRPAQEWLVLHAYVMLNADPTNAGVSRGGANASISTLIKQGLVPYYFVEGENFIEPSIEPSMNQKTKTKNAQSAPSSPSKKPKPKTKPTQQPTAAPTERKTAKKPTPTEAAIAAMLPYRAIVNEMANVCKKGYEGMFDPEHLTVKELESYTEAAADFARIGGTVEDVRGVYAAISGEYAKNDWKIAPASLAKGVVEFKANQREQQQQTEIRAAARAARISTTGRKVMTDDEREKLLADLRAERDQAFGHVSAAG